MLVRMGDELSARAIVDDAIAKAGDDDVGDDWFLTPLAAWADDLHDANLTAAGRAFLRRLAVNDVARRIEVLATIREHPEILDVEIPPIVYITGLERSGTTILHNLLALHSSLRPLLRWELMRPVPPPRADTYADDPRIAEVQASVEPLRGTLLERMHWVNADEPEECIWGFIDLTSLLGQAAAACMPTWGAFLRSNDLTPSYVHYRQVVQLLTWQHPVPTGGRLVLKAPQVTQDLAGFAAVFPEARFVITDRDPFRCVTSTRVMVAHLMDAFCVDNPIRSAHEDGYDWLATTDARLAGIARFDDDHPGRTVHVPYPDLARSPADTVAGVVEALALPHDPELGGRIQAFHVEQRAGRRAAPPEQLDTMGLRHDDVWSLPNVTAYCERFGIEPERERLTGS
jgi:hypothetical protein